MEIKGVTYQDNQLSSISYLENNVLKQVNQQDDTWKNFLLIHHSQLSKYKINKNAPAFLDEQLPVQKIKMKGSKGNQKNIYGFIMAIIAVGMFIIFVLNLDTNHIENHFSRSGRLLSLSWELSVFAICFTALSIMHIPKSVKNYAPKKKMLFIFMATLGVLTFLFVCLLVFSVAFSLI